MQNEQEIDSGDCPWQSVIEQFPAEFMQFYYPAAWQEIDWSLEVVVLAMPASDADDPFTGPPAWLPAEGNQGTQACDMPLPSRPARHWRRPAHPAVPGPCPGEAPASQTTAAQPALPPLVPEPMPEPGACLELLLQVYLRSGQRCRLYLYLGWQEQEPVALARHIYRNQCQLYAACDQPVASFAVLDGQAAQPGAATAFGWECLGNQLGMYFPCVYFADFAGQEAALRSEDNAFALLTLVQLVARETADNMAMRYSAKWELIQSMFERGWSRDRIIVLFQALDWSLPLPLRWSARLWRDIEQFEEQQIMRYVSSVERFVRERERQQGYQQGEATMLQHLLEHRFGELPLWVGMQIRTGSGEQRVAWLQRALAARNIDDVFHDGT